MTTRPEPQPFTPLKPSSRLGRYRLVTTLSILAIIAFASFGHVASADDAEASSLLASFPNGSYEVDVDIAPGTYVTEFDDGVCAVVITNLDGRRRNPTFLHRAIVTITPSDATVETSGCGTWRLLERPEKPLSEFGPGMYRVGIDILPGIYTASYNDGRCVWFTQEDLTHQPTSTNLINWWKTGTPVFQITHENVGFYSIRCGTWTRREYDRDQEPLHEFQDGSYLVGIDIAPGLYTTEAADGECNWFRTAPFGDAMPDNSGGYVSAGRQIAEILPTDTGFHSDGCGTWKRFHDPEAEPDPAGVIGQGTFAIGYDIQPGTYVADAVNDRLCRWFLLSGFAGRGSDISQTGNGILRGIIDVPPEAVGFRSIDCGEWSLVNGRVDVEPADRFGQGEHIVGVHIAPGIYTSPGPSTGRCIWRRITGFSGASVDNVAGRNPVGRNIAQIEDTDAIFDSLGCGTWQAFMPDEESDLLTSFTRGTWAVNDEVAPGTYVSDIPDGSTCFWSRLSAFTGETSDFLTSDLAVGHSVMTILPYDTGFYSDGCGTWTQIQDDVEVAMIEPTVEFEDGVYIVGNDISSGTYIANGIEGDICFWSRLDGFDGDIFNRINIYASSGQAIATILASDTGFRSFGCGTWRRADTGRASVDDGVQESDTPTTFRDGTYMVGADIAPGTYIAPNISGGACRWRRLSDFTWTSGTIVETLASGQKIVTIRADDVGFAAVGCGIWEPLDLDRVVQTRTPPTRFSSGSYLVGIDINPGTYYAIPRRNGGCRWSIVNDFDGVQESVISGGTHNGRWIVTIGPEARGFVTHGCGIWRDINIALPVGPYDRFDDGVYRVGADIIPGTYTTMVPTEPFINGQATPICRWSRISSFGHTAPEVIDAGVARGEIQISIADTDTGFISHGCGNWFKSD